MGGSGTALELASLAGHQDIVAELIRSGAKMNEKVLEETHGGGLAGRCHVSDRVQTEGVLERCKQCEERGAWKELLELTEKETVLESSKGALT